MLVFGSVRHEALHRLLPAGGLTLAVISGCGSEGRSFSEQGNGDASALDAGGTSIPSADASASSDDATSTGGGDVSSHSVDGSDSNRSDSNRSDSTTPDDSSGSASTSDAPTGDDPTSTVTSGDTSQTSDATSTGDASEEDFGVGSPPDYGDLGSGDGRILVVNTLAGGDSVDIWLAGGDAPVVADLALESATRVTAPHGAQRVVFTRTGTHEVIGCSEWFPLRAAEQWAVVGSGAQHTCIGGGDGTTLSFRQAQPLDENPVRYVHATAPDSLSFTRNEQAEPGTLEAAGTLTGTSLPNCNSGCEVRYRVSASGIEASRYVTLEVATVEELPTPGEVMLLVLGNIRQDWPSEPDALRLLRVDLDDRHVLRRDPELAFGRIGEGVATFNIITPPTTSELLSVDPYDRAPGPCPLQTLTWRKQRRTFFVEAPEGNSELEVELEAGHRYVLLSTTDSTVPLYWLDADFDRSQANEAYARVINLDPAADLLTIGRVFGDAAVEIDGLSDIPWHEVSAENGSLIPAEDNWRLLTANGDQSLGTGCFYSVDTVPGFRGYFVAADLMQPLDITSWPPTLSAAFQACF